MPHGAGFFGIIFALIAAFSFSAANMIDARLTRLDFKNVGVLLFYGCVLNLVFTLPVLLHPKFALPTGWNWALLFLSSQMRLLSYYLLFNALKRYETSVITCLTTLTLALVPVFSAVTGYEPLKPLQWLGFALCVASAIGLSWQKDTTKSVRKGLLYAFACGLTFCCCALVDDHLSNDLHWSAQYAGIQIFMLVTMGLFLLRRKFRTQIRHDFPIFKKNLRGFTGSEFTFAIGTIFVINAYKDAQVSVVEAVVASMPVLIFALSFMLPKRWTHEDLSCQALPRKLACFAVTIVGIYLLY